MGGDLASASSEHERAVDEGEVRHYSRVLERLVLARLLIARNEPGERACWRTFETVQTAGRTIEILALQALALRAKDERERAVSTLRPSFWPNRRATSGASWTRDRRWPILSGVLDARQRGRLESSDRIPAHYLGRLLAALERDASGAGLPRLPEPLSERELEVLQQ